MLRSVRAIREAAEAGGLAAAMIAGIHVEGPFISPLDGPRGAHDRRWVRDPDPEAAEALWEASRGRIRILTLAPEVPGALDMIRWCVDKGIIASIGHSAAEASDIALAVEAGARLSTHLGNGCAPLLRRHPNLIWEQLAEDRLAATMIADGLHLPASTMRAFHRTKGEGLMLVSDATALGGMPPGRYRAQIGGDVTLESDGRLHLDGNPSILAGAALSLLQGVHKLVDLGIADFATAWTMASARPSRLLGLGSPPGFVTYDPDSRQILASSLTKGK
jgi:N-acetylglucosamine-6-phosphate deacetylase